MVWTRKLYQMHSKPWVLFGHLLNDQYEITEKEDKLEIEIDNSVLDDIADINDYKYLINTEYIDPDDMVLYRTVDVVVQKYDTDIGPTIVFYRRRVQP